MELGEKVENGAWDSFQSLLMYVSSMIDAQDCKTSVLSQHRLEWHILVSSELVLTSHLMK